MTKFSIYRHSLFLTITVQLFCIFELCWQSALQNYANRNLLLQQILQDYANDLALPFRMCKNNEWTKIISEWEKMALELPYTQIQLHLSALSRHLFSKRRNQNHELNRNIFFFQKWKGRYDIVKIWSLFAFL